MDNFTIYFFNKIKAAGGKALLVGMPTFKRLYLGSNVAPASGEEPGRIPTTATIPAIDFEQGTISGHGETFTNARIRTIKYYELPAGNTGTVTATVSTSLSYAFDFCVQLYKSDKTTGFAYESAWVQCGMPLDLSIFPADSVYIRFVLKDNKTIVPEDITSMTYTFSS